MHSQSAITIKKLQSGYGQSRILFGVDFEAKREQITVIVGPNGGGKSTLLKSIFGLCTIHKGSVEYFGNVITKKPPYRISRMGVAYLPQINNVFANLTTNENLTMAAYSVNEETRLQRIKMVLESFPFLYERFNSKANTLSGGQKQMLAMAMALMRKPRVMLFDEPTANLSPKMANEVIKKISQIRIEFDATIVLVEQNIHRALKIGDMAYLVVNGKLAYSGQAKNLASHPDLGRMYLGAN
ncbi:MAG: ABC transporter ATP-binding protein [Cenarchaeum symbiont of Oopsacas minuta]|nr:ABC transporter ATP-binding protein [Cenarchaeum symbiont of Oopsacas minuta]